MAGSAKAQRQHRLDALADREGVARRAEADGMAEEIAHRAARRLDRRLAEPVRREPGAVRPGDGAGEIGDGGDHRRPGLDRRTVVRAVVAPWMKPQRARIVNGPDAATAEIRLDERPADRPRHGDQPPRGLGRAGRDGRAGRPPRFGARQAQEAPCLVGGVAEVR